VTAPSVPGVSIASESARRLQRRLALAVIAIPFLGSVAALALAMRDGVRGMELALLGGMYLLGTGGVSIGYHRHFAHRAFRAGPRMQAALAILGSTAAQGPLLFWVASHRRHHAFSDREGDPHSPHLDGGGPLSRWRGFWHAHLGWMLSEEITSWAHYARDLLRERRLFTLNPLYPVWLLAGLALPAAIGGAVSGTWRGALGGFLWGGLVRIFLANQASWCVGSVCHMFGSRPFKTADHSANNFWVALFTFGEGLQNNHHAFPSSAAHALRRWEPDLSLWLIRGLAALGLIHDVIIPTPEMIHDMRRGPAEAGGPVQGGT
jgi:stearoyl-CoA desaturase (Delta-9 desaturase)